MATPHNAPYKQQQREFRDRVRNRGRFIPNPVIVRDLGNGRTQRLTLNRATRRALQRMR